MERQNIRQILAIMATDIPDYTETMNNNETMSNNITNYLTPFLDYDIHYLTIVFDILILFLNTF